MIVAHFGLAVTGLLAWIAYLVTGLTSVAWTASGLLLPVIGLGMAMLILSLPERSLGASNPGRASHSSRRGARSCNG